MSLETQWMTLLWMLLSGGLLGIVFDSYRVVSGRLHFSHFSVHVLDLLYWIFAAVFVFRMLYISNHGELRFYVFLGLFLGIWIHFLFLSSLTERFVVMLMVITGRLYRILERTVYVLVIIPLYQLIRLGKFLLLVLWGLLLFIGRITGIPIWRLVRWLLKPLFTYFKIADRLTIMKNYVISLWNRLIRKA